MLDSHQHFWKVSRGDYRWMGAHVAPLQRDFGPGDLAPILTRNGVYRTILVQAAETEAETDFLIELAATTDYVAGVVGWLDLDAADFPEKLARYRANPAFVGLRPMLQCQEDDAFILRPRVLEHLKLVADEGVAFDILSFTRHLPHVLKALDRVPSLKAVVDHLSKPEIAAGTLDPWRDLIEEVADFPNVHCKISGMVTEASANWSVDDFRPYVDHVFACFGEDRLMFGSNWPVATLAGSYEQVLNLSRTLVGPYVGRDGAAKIFEHNAARFYRVPVN